MTLAGRRTRRHCRRVRSVFVVTGAFLGRVDGETRCAFWADDPVGARVRSRAADRGRPGAHAERRGGGV
jgi:hypothetical protein